MDWVSNTLHPFVVKSNGGMPLAAHLCRERFNEVLRGEGGFLERLTSLGFRRVQIHATAVNGVDTSDLSGGATHLMTLMSQFPYLEFIIQRSDETSELWKAVEKVNPPNMSMLFDESKGTGVAPEGGYEVRLGEEGSNEQTTLALGTKITHTRTFLQDTPPPQPPQQLSLLVLTLLAIPFAHHRLHRRIMRWATPEVSGLGMWGTCWGGFWRRLREGAFGLIWRAA